MGMFDGVKVGSSGSFVVGSMVLVREKGAVKELGVIMSDGSVGPKPKKSTIVPPNIELGRTSVSRRSRGGKDKRYAGELLKPFR